MDLKSRNRDFMRAVLQILLSMVALVIVLSGLDSLVVLGKLSLVAFRVEPLGVDTATKALASTSRVATMLLAMLISGMAIALPLAANNYTPRLITMFTRDPINRAMFGLLLTFGVVAMWTSWVIRTAFIPHFGIHLCFFLFLASMSAIVPYLFYLFSFLNPESILVRLRTEAEKRIAQACRIRRDDSKEFAQTVWELKQDVVQRLDSISNIALGTLSRRDRQAFTRSLETLQHLETHYTKLKSDLPPEWFMVRASCLAGALPEAREAVEQERLILEMHLSNALLGLIESSLSYMRDAVNDVAFTVYRIASSSVLKQDYPAVRKYCALFNSTLRLGINRNDIRLIYNVLPHYRRVADDAAPLSPGFSLEIARYIHDYALTAAKTSPHLGFAVELAAHELAGLVKVLVTHDEAPLAQCVGLLCDLPTRQPTGEVIQSVLKERLVAAVTIDPAGASELSAQLAAPMRELSDAELKHFRQRFLVDTPLLYWEITARQVNLDHVPDEKRALLAALLDKIEGTPKADA